MYNVHMALIQKTVYFREEDLPRWQAIKNKAKWLHEHLGMISTNTKNNGVITETFLQDQYDKAAKVGDPEFNEPTYTDSEDTA